MCSKNLRNVKLVFFQALDTFILGLYTTYSSKTFAVKLFDVVARAPAVHGDTVKHIHVRCDTMRKF